VPLRGFWSALGLAHSCAAPDGNPGELEIYCHENEFGITELNEPIAEHIGDGRVVFADGPHLTPWVQNELWRTLDDSLARPVPIVVVGHFDDPRAAECRAEAVQLCRERFVIDAILEYGG
jgi:hypothetical protein